MSNSPRPRPIAVTQALMVSVGAVVTSAGFAGQIPAKAAWWIITGYIAVQAGLAFYLQSVTTPVDSPKDRDGRDLVPAGTTTVTVADGTATVVSPEGTGPAVAADGSLSWTQPDLSKPVQPRPDA